MFDEILTETFNVFIKNIKRYAILALVIALPLYFLTLSWQGATLGFDTLKNNAAIFTMLRNIGNPEAMKQSTQQNQEHQKQMMENYLNPKKSVPFFLGMLILGMLALVGTIACTYVTDDIYQLREMPLKNILGSAFKKLPGLIVIAVITGIVIGIGFVLLIIPGIILLVKFSFSLPVYVMEDISVTGAISRSWQLTKGKKGAIFLINLIFIILLYIVSAIIGILFAAIAVAIPGLVSVILIQGISMAIKTLLGFVFIIAAYLFYGKTVGLIAMKGKLEPEWETPKSIG